MTKPIDPEDPSLTHAERNGAVPYEEHARADEERFDKRRKALAASIAEDMARETALTVGPIVVVDDDTKRLVEEAKQEIKAKYAKLEARQMARIDQEEREREERTRTLYDR